VLCTGCYQHEQQNQTASIVNLDHLDYLGEEVRRNDTTYRIIHLYAEAPDYLWLDDDDEGTACLDDAARAAILYLRHYELTADTSSLEKARQLLRFVMYMQREDGLFYNFVWNNRLEINTEHPNSRAEPFGWWAARGVWALGVGVKSLSDVDPSLTDSLATSLQKALLHLQDFVSRYGQTTDRGGYAFPLWLLYETASDATSELLLGLSAYYQVRPDSGLKTIIDRLSEGISMMQYGSMNTFPYGAHASWIEGWHGWGNAQTMALAGTSYTTTATREAEHFFPRLLIEGWMHSFNLDDPDSRREFEQIAYAIRCVTLGLIRLYEATNDGRFVKMAGIASSWLTGNNIAGVSMYETTSGRGYDGISRPGTVNYNSGAESTIEALLTILEVEQHPEAHRWLSARGDPPVNISSNGIDYLYRVFNTSKRNRSERLALVMNLTEEKLLILEGRRLETFLNSLS